MSFVEDSIRSHGLESQACRLRQASVALMRSAFDRYWTERMPVLVQKNQVRSAPVKEICRRQSAMPKNAAKDAVNKIVAASKKPLAFHS